MTLYNIVPINDGFHILGRSKVGEFFLISKNTNDLFRRGELIFYTKEDAQKFIDDNNLENYQPEEFWRAEKYMAGLEIIQFPNIKTHRILTCPECGHSLHCMCTVGANESISGFSESLYHCKNDDCANDFNVIRDADGRFVKMTRHFWG